MSYIKHCASNFTNSAYRNIRLHFWGTVGQCYTVYLLNPILLIFTLGLYYPRLVFLRKEYFFNNFSLGKTDSIFFGESGFFYGVFIKAYVYFTVSVLILIFINYLMPEPILIVVSYLALMVYILLLPSYIYVKLQNYCWSKTNLGKLKFVSQLDFKDYVWLRISNSLAILFTLGLMIPWAEVRRIRYILDNLTVIATKTEMNDFIADTMEDTSAYGDSAA